ncbi:dTDP-4-dehydrorhamnose 3,5-epimerase family protein [Actinocrispum wychmicini]|uniref:dTDP-4-dehydrorhamnose 3,5-epimerase n=1 Tax=Actinocrispum wychmicini TaxID=1213861 RepID=A0A4R2KH21_9PSEU|nr:dTDP-4-dehydrorhamnose 3,5-epimerase family protein [Actinocrispum wychmicini]TCO65735.1 dTDP-4-dehydrorhamnose 3,5-epimerase [Actinocrispum wychmicini]
MQVRELSIAGAFEFQPQTFADGRGMFAAPFQGDAFAEAVGHPLRLGQTNHSVSRRGTIRGVHFADTPPGQAKYIYCPRGAMLDVIVDIRVGSPTFGQWECVKLDAHTYSAVYVPEGLGHGFFALEDDTAMIYLCSTGYNPSGEHGITPMDPTLDLPWPADIEPVLSDKDQNAPTLAEAADAGLLPSYEKCMAHYQSLREGY